MDNTYKSYDSYDSKKDLDYYWGNTDIDEITAAYLAGKDLSKEIQLER